MSNSSYQVRKKLFEEIERLNKDELQELYKICKKNGEPMSENSNGIFFNLLNLKDETIEDIKVWLNHCKDNKILFDEREKEMDDLRNEPPVEED